MLDEKTWEFVREHLGDDVHQLALQAARWPGVDIPAALQQIAGQQVARAKVPQWAAIDGLLYPPHLSMEQCSSEATAQYKANLVDGDSLCDLTGGLGVDFSFMARYASQATYVECQKHLCDIARHNLPLLGLPNAQVINDDAVDYLNKMAPVDTLYLDPARRDLAGKRVYALTDCTPDVTLLAPTLLEKAQKVIIKLSPMLDLHAAIRQLPCVEQVHIVSVRGECKEMLLMLRRGYEGAVTVHCINDNQAFDYTLGVSSVTAPLWDETMPSEGLYLYEPNASLMKAGCHNLVAAHFGLQLMGRDSHLMLSDRLCDQFPGRSFAVQGISTMNKRELKALLHDVTHANVAVRNFPMSAPQLSQRLKVKDGGNQYLFGTTTASGRHIIILASPLNSEQ